MYAPLPLISCYPPLRPSSPRPFDAQRHGAVRRFDREKEPATYVYNAFPLKRCRLQLAFGNCGIRGIMIIDDFPESAKLSSFIRRQFVRRT